MAQIGQTHPPRGRVPSGPMGLPIRLYGPVAASAAVVATLLLVLGLRVPMLLAWVAGAGIVAFALYGVDKAQARGGGGRVPEAVLLTLSAAGGFVGGFLGMAIWRHKTRHTAFYLANAVGLALGIVVALLLPGAVWPW